MNNALTPIQYASDIQYNREYNINAKKYDTMQ